MVSVFRCVCVVVVLTYVCVCFCSAGNQSSTKVIVSNLPSNARFEDLEQLLAPYGAPQNYEKLSTKDGPTQVVQISFDTPEQAQQWVQCFVLKVRLR